MKTKLQSFKVQTTNEQANIIIELAGRVGYLHSKLPVWSFLVFHENGLVESTEGMGVFEYNPYKKLHYSEAIDLLNEIGVDTPKQINAPDMSGYNPTVTPELSMEDTMAKVIKFKERTIDWDGCGGLPPIEDTVENAVEMLARIGKLFPNVNPPDVECNHRGEVVIYWDGEDGSFGTELCFDTESAGVSNGPLPTEIHDFFESMNNLEMEDCDME